MIIIIIIPAPVLLVTVTTVGCSFLMHVTVLCDSSV